MTAKYWQKGEVLDYKAGAAVKNGEVVSLGTRIGVAGEDIAAGETGHLHVVGVFEMEKATGAVTMHQCSFFHCFLSFSGRLPLYALHSGSLTTTLPDIPLLALSKVKYGLTCR